MLPLLIVLFLISYGLMATLVVEQNRTIQSQRTLIRQLFTDSTQLSALKGKAAQDQAKAQTQKQFEEQHPSSQASPRNHPRSSRSTNKTQKPAPERPPRPASDTTDVRRALISI